MKTFLLALSGIFAVAALAVADPAETRLRPTEATGTVTMVDSNANTFIVSTPGHDTPVTYGYSKTTEVVDEAGNPVPWGIVKKKTPVTVYFKVVGGEMVATKLVVQPLPLPALEQTTTQTTAPR
jgi:hypothetical protein